MGLSMTTKTNEAATPALCPATDVLIRRHRWSIFDFQIRDNMGARTSGKFDWSKGFGAKGFCRSYLRSPKRYRRWLGIDCITYIDQLLAPGDPILFEKTGFDWIMRRSLFEILEKPVGFPSIDDHRRAHETCDESIFDRLATVAAVGDFDFTVEQGGNSWKISCVAMAYTSHVYLKA
jgi:hypothetical protein